MNSQSKLVTLALLLAAILASTVALAAPPSTVIVGRVPDGGIQPRLVNDGEERIHLLYFQPVSPKARVGHYIYRQYTPSTQIDDTPRASQYTWSGPVTVNPEPVSYADAIGRAAMAIDDDGRAHVTWFDGGYHYARSDTQRTQFSVPTRPISTHLDGIEAGAAIATFGNDVILSWHAGDMADESKRRVYLVRSTDHGETFGEAVAVSDPELGVCACCALATGFSSAGQARFAYRSAIANEGRHMQVITQNGAESQTEAISEWNLNTCPVSTNVIVGDWLAFETRGDILTFKFGARKPATQISVTVDVRQKHPAIAINTMGDRVIAWGAAPGYVKGGQIRLKMFTADDEEVAPTILGSITGTIPDYSSLAVAALKDGSFLMLY